MLTPRNFASHVDIPAPVIDLPNIVGQDDARLVPSHFESVTSTPMPIADMIMTAPFEDVEASLTLSRNDRCQIEIETRGQSKNMKWFQHRRGSVTASRFSDIRRFMHGARISEQRLVEEVLGTKYKTMAFPTCPNKPSWKWGLANEAKAKAKYKELMSTSHKGLEILDSGLLVHRPKGYIRCSPDGIVICKCYPPRLLEIKCPYTCRNDTWDTVIAENKLPYIETTPTVVSLRNTPSYGYLDQVQLRQSSSVRVAGLPLCCVHN